MPVFLRDPSDSSGELRRYDDEGMAARAITQLGFVEASDAEVEARVVERESEALQSSEYGDKGGSAFLRAAGAGAFDAVTAVPRLAATAGAFISGAENKDPLGHILGGREFMANVAAVSGELLGDDTAEAAHRHWSEESRKIAKANPWASTSGYLAGQVVGGLGVSGASAGLGKAAASAAASSALGSTAARRAALALVTEGAVEGGVLSVGEAGEQAWIQNQKLTSEQIVGAIGWGTLLGAGAGGALYGGGAVYRGGKRAASAAGDSLRAVFGGGPSVTASADVVEEVGARALGAKPGTGFGKKAKDAFQWAREKLEAGQAITTGADPDTIAKYGGLRWDSEARAGRDLYINRDGIIEGAKKDFNRGLTELTNAAEPIIDEVRLTGLKREHVAKHLSDQPVEQLAEARMQADAIADMLVPLRKPGSAAKAKRGKADPIDREAYLQTLGDDVRDQIDDEIADDINDLLELTGVEAKQGGPAWKRAEQQVLRERVEPQLKQAEGMAPTDPREGSLRAEVGHGATVGEVVNFFTRQVDAIKQTTDPAEAYILLDRTKGALQKWADSLGKYANNPQGGRPTSPERVQGARRLAEYLDSRQEPLRQSLMNEGVWGKAGANQRAINQAYVRYIESSKLFNQRFMKTESVGYMGRGATRVARDDSTGAFLDRLGRADNTSAEQHLRAHLRATLDFTGAIDEALDIGPKRELLERARATEKQLSGMLDKLDSTVKVANQIDELMKADSQSLGGSGKTLIGGLIGGAPGAAVGWAADIASHPGRLMRQAIGIQRVAKRFNVDLDNGIDAVFDRVKRKPEPPTPAAPAAAPSVANDVDDEVFKDEVSGVRTIDPAKVAGGAGLIAAGAATTDDSKDGALAGAAAIPFLGKAAVRKAARGALAATKQAAAHVTPLGVAVPLGLRAFMGDHDDKQQAFKARAKEIHDATEDFGERVRQVAASELGDIPSDFPKFANGLVASMTRGALFLESKLPPVYRAQVPGSPGRSTSPVADHDIAKFARYWSAVNDPISVLHDMQLGLMTNEQVESIKTVYPELWSDISERLLDRAAKADAKGERIPSQLRSQIGRFVGFATEPAFKQSVLDTLERAKGERDQQQQQPPGKPLTNLAANMSPESMQVQQRAARM